MICTIMHYCTSMIRNDWYSSVSTSTRSVGDQRPLKVSRRQAAPLDGGHRLGVASGARRIFNECHIVQITSQWQRDSNTEVAFPKNGMATDSFPLHPLIHGICSSVRQKGLRLNAVKATIHVQAAEWLRPIQLHPYMMSCSPCS